MKKFILIILLFAMIGFEANGQSNPQDYLDMAKEKLEAGDCDAAQRLYNVYKSLSGRTSSTLEVAIKDCVENNKPKSYRIGDDAKDLVGESGFKIAYLDDSGKHGFAIKFWGNQRGPTSKPPTRNDCKVMYNRRITLGLSGEYWTGERNRWRDKYYTFDFSTGKERTRNFGKGGHYANAIEVKRF